MPGQDQEHGRSSKHKLSQRQDWMAKDETMERWDNCTWTTTTVSMSRSEWLARHTSWSVVSGCAPQLVQWHVCIRLQIVAAGDEGRDRRLTDSASVRRAQVVSAMDVRCCTGRQTQMMEACSQSTASSQVSESFSASASASPGGKRAQLRE